MREYEIMVIVDGSAEDQQVDAVVERITQVLEKGDSKVAKVDRWGKRKFAYEIDHKTEGHYFVMDFTSDGEVIPELERVLLLADEVIRHKVVRKVAA